MYVCSCNGYRDTDLYDVAREGISSAVEAYHALGNGPCCGTCLDSAQKIIDEAHLELTSSACAASDHRVNERRGVRPC